MEYNFLVDSHCHLDMVESKGFDLDTVINEAKSNSVNVILNASSNIKNSPKVIQIAEKYNEVYAAVGNHPLHANEGVVVGVEDLMDFVNHPKVIGIGESGLDYYYEPYDKKAQFKNFEAHIEACRRTNLPLIIHSRNADKDMMEILESEMKNGDFSFELHCFSSGRELAYKGLDLGGYISFSGVITFKNAKELVEIAKDIPLDRVLVETDAPYLAPTPYRGKINQPAYTLHTAEKLAELKGKSYNEIRSTTTENFLRLFSKVDLTKVI